MWKTILWLESGAPLTVMKFTHYCLLYMGGLKKTNNLNISELCTVDGMDIGYFKGRMYTRFYLHIQALRFDDD